MTISKLSNSEFLSKIIEDTDTGRCFVPLLGSGFSSPSGIIMGMEFTNYLAFTTYLVLSDPKQRPKIHGEGIPAHWNLRHQGWPPLPSSADVELARKWILEQFQDICRRYEIDPNYQEKTEKIKSLSQKRMRPVSHELVATLVHPQVPSILASTTLEREEERFTRIAGVLIRHASDRNLPTPAAVDLILSDSSRSYRQRLVEIGIRSLHDWRETLVFLASVSVESQGFLAHGSQNDSVIDRFNSFITRDKQPNLGHKMIAHLTGPMRIQTLLTTNFDTLMEDAFRSLGFRVRVLPVSSKGRLPEAHIVSAERAIVKLHGEVHDTRADTSLDEEPADEDKQTFTAYLTRGVGNTCRHQPAEESKRLFVIGYSASDHRCVQMVKSWLERGLGKPLVYWVCFSESDVARVAEIFKADEYANSLRVTQCSRPDLLLYELYQRLMLALPPGGLTYEFSHIVPPRRPKPYDNDTQVVESVLACSKTREHPLEVARMFLPFAPIDAAKRLCRDTIALDVKQLVCKLLAGEVDFYDPNGNYTSYQSTMSTAALWRPFYISKDAAGAKRANRENDQKSVFHEFGSRPVIIDAPGGVVRGIALAVDELAASRATRVFWIETSDYMDADALLRDLLRAIAMRCGSYQGTHVTQHPLEAPLSESKDLKTDAKEIAGHLKRVLEDYRIDANQLLVLIYGRDSYGGSSGLLPSPWLDKDSFKPLHCIIDALGRGGIPVMYFPLLMDRATRKKEQTTWNVEDAPKVPPTLKHIRQRIDKSRDWPFDELAADAFKADMTGATPIDFRGSSVIRGIIKSVMEPYYLCSGTDATQWDTSLTPLDVRKLIFLYSLTLFRHSRHVNALCSEGAFQCPHRFNSSAIDNDYIRSEEIVRWISTLREARVFFDKPGGSVWMHRDVRLTMQDLFENIEVFRNDEPGEEPLSSNQYLIESRARLHFWIGDWYHKAFCSSGHLTPVIESVHHRVMAAIYSQFARFKGGEVKKNEIKLYQRLLFESAILEAHKTLYIAWELLKLWQSSPLPISWIGESHRKRVGDSLQTSISKICETQSQSEALQRIVKSFVEAMASLEHVLLVEGGGSRDSSPLPTPVSAPLSQNATNVRSGQSLVGTSEKLSLDHGWRTVCSSDQEFFDKVNAAFSSPLVGGSKASNTQHLVLNCINDIADASVKNDDRTGGHVREFSKQKAQWKMQHASDPQKLHDMIWLLGEYAYLMLRRAKLLYHTEDEIQFGLWIRATVACNLGVDLCKHLPPWLWRFDTQSKLKFHTLYGVCLANLGRFFEASRHLNDAEALLSKCPDCSPADAAVINLRRAEVLLTKCVWISAFIEESGKKGVWRPENRVLVIKNDVGGAVQIQSTLTQNLSRTATILLMDGRPDSESWNEETVAAAIEAFKGNSCVFVPPGIAECLRKAMPKVFSGDETSQRTWIAGAQPSLRCLYLSALDEATVLLDQAEYDLCGRSQSSLWWSRLHTLRLRIYGLLNPLDDKSMECVILRKRSADQGIFEAFRNALRVARYDPFRSYRAIKYFFHANAWHRQFEGNANEVTRLPDSYYEHAKPLLEKLAVDHASTSKLGSAIQKLSNIVEKDEDHMQKVSAR